MLHVPGGLDFVWFDLVCIPQDGSAVGAKEIARQAKIFRGAKYVIVWLNAMETVDGIFGGMAWSALRFLALSRSDDQRRRTAAVQSAWTVLKRNGTGLYLPRPGDCKFASWVLNPWFTSLWTLQEVCLRPGMWICAKDWTPLTSDGAMPITMGGFVAILESDRTVMRDETDIAYLEFIHWRYTTALQTLLDLDPVSILSLRDRRECSGRRAEAIMSVVGATDWYKNALQSSNAIGKLATASLEKDLVFGKYPTEFFNELACKLPGAFFAGVDKTSLTSPYNDVHAQTQEGSMLPFSADLTSNSVSNLYPNPWVCGSTYSIDQDLDRPKRWNRSDSARNDYQFERTLR